MHSQLLVQGFSQNSGAPKWAVSLVSFSSPKKTALSQKARGVHVPRLCGQDIVAEEGRASGFLRPESNPFFFGRWWRFPPAIGAVSLTVSFFG